MSCSFFWTRILMARKVNFMNQTKNQWNSILGKEAFGFSFLIILSWLVEALHIPHLIFGEPFAPDWRRAILRTLVLSLIWIWVHYATRRLLKRLHYLEESLRVCGWCRKVCDHGKWLTMEAYFDSRFATQTSHGMCPECLQNKKDELKPKKNSPTTPGK